MKTIHPAVAGHVMEENGKLRAALRKIIERCELFINDEADMRTHSIEALMGIAEDALSQHAEPTDTFTAVDMATAAAQGFRDGQAATVKDCLTVQPMAYAVFAANGNVVCFSTRRDHPSLVALESDGHSVVSLAPITQTAPQPEQSGLVESALRKAVAYLDENPFNEIASGSILHRVMGAALSAQGAGDASA